MRTRWFDTEAAVEALVVDAQRRQLLFFSLSQAREGVPVETELGQIGVVVGEEVPHFYVTGFVVGEAKH
jgi:hypothetical protein